ncbi:ubiquitin-conjugating enzyme E2 S [Tieghemostelium lacteum]|uniref:E2 ubiquitin-conjugating enzyme n=1 Tax=Tieghemostelium lacteum TaxID=361077 RepID=A0A151ZCM4_TIELA|nr:ubiquitin-conjugating enzyme E2 S [Tieghemostelium lacteum]|eukprot:KYQ91702.1 ubiquitin-conjugating enzyme E2 S [Tieghemostelium lacteum]
MSSGEVLPNEVIKRVFKELKDLTVNQLEGITLIPCESDVTNIEAIITGPTGTPYEGGYFRAKLILCPEFPKVPPKANFLTKIFHPNVSKKGEICVNTLKKDWTEDLGLKHILLTIKCLLIVPNAESSLNEDASRMLLENYDDYCKHAKLMTSIHASKSPIVNIQPQEPVNNENNNNNVPINNECDSKITSTTTTTTISNTISSPLKKKTDTPVTTKPLVKKSLKRL